MIFQQRELRLYDTSSANVSGVVDDRGKFIYISREELEAVAKFIKQRGRVSISEISDSSNSLINLEAALQRREVQPLETPA